MEVFDDDPDDCEITRWYSSNTEWYPPRTERPYSLNNRVEILLSLDFCEKARKLNDGTKETMKQKKQRFVNTANRALKNRRKRRLEEVDDESVVDTHNTNQYQPLNQDQQQSNSRH